MELDRLSEFSTIARLGSLKLASQELGVSSATLSARILRFEEQLGTQLFQRNSNGLVLTEAGQSLLPHSLDILESFQKIRGSILATQEHNYHRLRIAVASSVLPLHLGPFLDRLVLDNPDIHLEILDDTKYSIVSGLQSGEVDIYFASVMDDFSAPGLFKVPIATPGHNIILPKSHRLADRSIVSIKELDQEQFLLHPTSAEPTIREFQMKNLQDAGIRYTLYQSETSAIFYMLLVPIGKGILLYPDHIIDLPPNSVSMPISDLPHPAKLCYFYSKANPNPDVQAFVQDFSQYVKEVSTSEHHTNL